MEWLDAVVKHLDQTDGVRESCLMVVVLGAHGIAVPWPLKERPPLVPRRWHVAADGQASHVDSSAVRVAVQVV